MTNGDKIKLRAELAGKAMQGLLAESGAWAGDPNYCAKVALVHADSLMAELGISMEESGYDYSREIAGEAEDE